MMPTPALIASGSSSPNTPPSISPPALRRSTRIIKAATQVDGEWFYDASPDLDPSFVPHVPHVDTRPRLSKYSLINRKAKIPVGKAARKQAKKAVKLAKARARIARKIANTAGPSVKVSRTAELPPAVQHPTIAKITLLHGVLVLPPFELPPLPVIAASSPLAREALTHHGGQSKTLVLGRDCMFAALLGDSMAENYIREYAYELDPPVTTAFTTAMQGWLVRNTTWAQLSIRYGLPGKLIGKDSLRTQMKVQADLFEAHIGAFYLSFPKETRDAMAGPPLRAYFTALLDQLWPLLAAYLKEPKGDSLAQVPERKARYVKAKRPRGVISGQGPWYEDERARHRGMGQPAEVDLDTVIDLTGLENEEAVDEMDDVDDVDEAAWFEITGSITRQVVGAETEEGQVGSDGVKGEEEELEDVEIGDGEETEEQEDEEMDMIEEEQDSSWLTEEEEE